MLQLLDLAGIYFRAFYAVPASTTSPDGRPVNAVRGSLDILARVIADARPNRVIACLDLDWRPAWRVELIPSYKTHRVADPQTALAATTVELAVTPHSGTPGASADIEAVPDELSQQVPILLDVLAAVGIATAGAPGFEADDVIGTLAAGERTDPVEVVTGDRDLFQVARDSDPSVSVRYIGAGMRKVAMYSAGTVAQRYAIPEGSYADFAALRGDPSDGLPGVPGVGEKTASGLIQRWGSIEAIVAALDSGDPELSQRAKLAPARDYLGVAAGVTRVRTDCPLVAHDPRIREVPIDPERVVELVDRWGIDASVNRWLSAARTTLDPSHG